MDEAAIWANHLKSGEQLVWQGAASQSLREAHRRRMVVRNSLLALAAVVLAAVFAWRFYEAAFSASHQPDLTAAVTLPLYFAFAVALAVAAFWLVRRLTLPMDGADYYAATNQRLLAANADGRLVQEIDAAAMAGLVVDTKHPPTSLQILRRDEPGTSQSFVMDHVEDIPFVAAMIRQTFPEATQ